ncbi:MAG: sensor histidine kinase [Gammaproteobacteria bacterium]|nr:MAG: sensor histidine kinase [Gammaproteobacteria bacterium]
MPAAAEIQLLRQRVLARAAARLAHDFNNDLTVIGGQAELAQRPTAGRLPERLEQIIKVTGTARDRSRLVLELAHAELGAEEVIAGESLRDDVEHLVALLAGRDATVEVQVGDDLPATDKMRLQWLTAALVLAGVPEPGHPYAHLFLNLTADQAGIGIELTAMTGAPLPPWLAEATAAVGATVRLDSTANGWVAHAVLPHPTAA